MVPKKQGQHQLGEVYLNSFAFTYKGQRNLCVRKKGENRVSRKNVGSFNKKINFFDLPDEFGKDFRLFETLNGQLETVYPKIIEKIEATILLDSEDESILKKFVANMLCRMDLFRNKMYDFYNDPRTKEKFISEISIFVEKSKADSIRSIEQISIEGRLNCLMLFVMHHINFVLQKFSYCILKDFDERGWVTGDNPVIIEDNNVFGVIIPLEAEIYFPLTKKHCLYMHFEQSENKKNALRNIPKGTIVDAPEDIHRMVLDKMAENAKEYVIFPWNLGRINLDNI